MALKDYSHQKLSGTDFSGVDLTEADMSHSDLSGANFALARLQDANLTFANMAGVNLGETQEFKCVAISPDGQLLASASRDRLIRFWESSSGRELRVLQGHTSDINDLVFSPNGHLLASASDDKTIRLWDVTNGRAVLTFQGHTEYVRCVTFSPDGSLLASGGGWRDKDTSVRLWEVSSGRELAVSQGHTGRVTTLAFSPNGQTLASGSNDKSVRLWNAKSLAAMRVVSDFPEAIKSVAFDDTGKQLFVLSNDLVVLDVDTGQITLDLPGHIDKVNSVAVSPNGQLLASASDDKSLRLWDLASGRQISVLRGHTDSVNCVVFSPDGQLLASAGRDKSVRLWDLASGHEIAALQPGTDYAQAVVFSPDGRLLVIGTGGIYSDKEKDNSVRIWDIESQSELRALQGHTKRINSVAISPDGRLIASGSEDKSVRLWDTETGQELCTFEGHTSSVRAVAFSLDQRLVVSGSNDKTICLWDIETGQQVAKLQKHNDYVTSVVTSPDGRLLASGSDDKSVRLWDLESRREVRVFEGHADYVYGVAFSPDGRQIASVSGDKSVKLWDVDTGGEIRTMVGRSEPRAMALLGEKRVAVAVDSGIVEIWQLSDFQKPATHKIHSGTINGLSFSPRANLLASASNDKSLGLLDTKTGQHRLIRQELHCLRANIFGVRGLRDDQKALMLRKGAIEIDPQELPSVWQPRNIREIVRTKRLRALANKISKSQKRERLPVILIVGPGTFLPTSERGIGETYYDLERLLPMPLERMKQDLPEAQRAFEFLYHRLMMDPDYWRYMQRRSPERWEKSRYRQQELVPILRENYNALIQLINERFFSVVLDFDVFSELDRGMFSSSVSGGKYAELEDLEYSIHRLSRDLRYVEKGQTVFLKYFSEEWCRSSEVSPWKRRDPYTLRRVFQELFERLFLEFKREVSIIWTGFYTRELAYPFERFIKRESRESLYWIIDESIRESDSEQIPAVYVDYPLGRFSDVFHDLYTELGFSKRALYTEIQDYDITRLRRMAHSDQEEERIRAARELISRLIENPDIRSSQLQELINALKRDYVPAVRQSVLRAILENYGRLPKGLSVLVSEFSHDPDDTIRADVARWILSQYNEVGATHDSSLRELAQDRSQFVRQVIIDTVTQRFERLPAPIRLLASQLVGAQIEVQMVKGSGMLVGEPSELVLRVTNHNESALEQVVVEIIQPSAEYQVVSNNPISANSLPSGQTIEVGFQLKMKVPRQIAVNYKVNGELKEPPLYINAIKDNPYVYGDPVKDDFAFFGRKEELEQIVQAITKPTKQDILVVGERRMGKTSLIYQLVKRLERPFIPVYVVLNICEPKTESILSLILHKTIHNLIEQNLLTPDWEHHHFRHVDFEDNVREIIDAAKAKLTDVRVVLFLDEADYLLKIEMTRPGIQGIVDVIMGRHLIDERVQNILRAALQSAKIGGDLRAVVAGTSDLSKYISQRSSPFFNHFRVVPLKPFTSNEIRELITKPASSLGYSYSPSAVERIMSLSGGQPFYCQSLCYEAFGNALKAGRYLIGDQDVQVAEDRRLNDQFGAYLSYFWSRTDKTEKRFLSALAQGDDTSEFSHAQIKRLLEWGIIIQSEGRYAFAGGLVEKWTQMASGKR